MVYTVTIFSSKVFCFANFVDELDLYGIIVDFQDGNAEEEFYYFSIKEQSTTSFLLRYQKQAGKFELSIDAIASYADYKLFPYLIDTLSFYLNGEELEIDVDGTISSSYQFYNENWIEDMIGEEIAMIKSVLSVTSRVYFSIPKEEYTYVSKEVLENCGVSLFASTPRIYGYIQLLLKKGLLPQATEQQILEDMNANVEGEEVDVPQHLSIGKIKSWQLDGEVVWDSYSIEDIKLLNILEAKYKVGDESILAEVLNDIGSIYQEGVGVEQDGHSAEYWFKQAIVKGDMKYAPVNLGDLYRKGNVNVDINLLAAFDAYSVSIDPYAWFRIGEAYEHGWISEPDITLAMVWYEKAAKVGHHRALKRLNRSSKNSEPDFATQKS